MRKRSLFYFTLIALLQMSHSYNQKLEPKPYSLDMKPYLTIVSIFWAWHCPRHLWASSEDHWGHHEECPLQIPRSGREGIVLTILWQLWWGSLGTGSKSCSPGHRWTPPGICPRCQAHCRSPPTKWEVGGRLRGIPAPPNTTQTKDQKQAHLARAGIEFILDTSSQRLESDIQKRNTQL